MQQTYFVTGTSAGLGRAIVESALTQGHRVFATARKTQSLEDLASKHRELLHVAPLDVTSNEAWQEAMASAISRFGAVDVLVNNAGFGGVGSLEDMPLDLVRELIDTNFVGSVLACQTALPIMRKQQHGRIILVSSIGARIATPGASIYYASKAAVSAMAETLAQEVKPFGIKVTAVEPGGMRTRFAESGSLKVIESNPAYASTVGATVSMMQSEQYASYLADPAGHAELILNLSQLEEPPPRLLAGQDAYAYGTEADKRRSASDVEWEQFSRAATPSSTD